MIEGPLRELAPPPIRGSIIRPGRSDSSVPMEQSPLRNSSKSVSISPRASPPPPDLRPTSEDANKQVKRLQEHPG